MPDDTTNPTSSGSQQVSPQGILSFSGSRQSLTTFQRDIVLARTLQIGASATGYITGACIGIDLHVGRFCLETWPERQHTVIVPADRSRVSAWWHDYDPGAVAVIEMPPNSSYKDRNLALVMASDRLVAYPAAAEQHHSQRRSGTWQTIRLAQQHHAARPLWWPLDAMNPASGRRHPA